MSGTPEQALANGRRQLAMAHAEYERGIAMSTGTAVFATRRRGEKIIANAERTIRHLAREVRRLETEVQVASLQAGLVPSMPAPLDAAPTHRVPARYPEPQR